MSNDLRKRVVKFVETRHSRHEAVEHFGTSVSFAVNLMKLYRHTGRVDPKPRGGFRHGKLGSHRVFILRQVEAKHDISMPELAALLREAKGVEVAPATLSRFLIACGLSFKKRSGHPNKIGLTLPRREANGKMAVSQSCAVSVTG